MELKTSSVLAVLASVTMFVQVFSSPIGDASQAAIQEEKRPKYMDTRDLDYFKDLLMYALDELVDEQKLNPDIFAAPSSVAKTEKRGRHLGFCLRRTASGVSAIPCWKNEGRR